MGYVQLLGVAQLLRPWNPTGHCHPHFLFLTAYLKQLETPLCKRRDNFERHVLQSHIGIVNYLTLVVPVVSKKCQVSIYSS